MLVSTQHTPTNQTYEMSISFVEPDSTEASSTKMVKIEKFSQKPA